MLLEEIFFEIGAIIIVAATLSMLMQWLRQPLIIAYIIAGVIIGPSIFALARSTEMFDNLAQIGVAFLLFTVGLGLNWRNVKDVGGIALATGVGQVVFTSAVGFLIGQALGFDTVVSLYLSIAFAFSSTIIIVKILMDKEDLDSLYGRISIGFLLVQDFIAMIVLLLLSALSTSAGPADIILQSLFKAVIVIPLLWFVSAKIVPSLVRYAARSQELLLIFSVAWCFLVAGGFVMAGFSLEIGALIAGVMLSGTPFQREINARIHTLRDFFLIIFFIVLGTKLGLHDLNSSLLPILVFSAFILVGNPLIVLIIMRLLGYHPRTGFLAGTTVAQISEFSFIVLAAGVSVGHLPANTITLAAAVGLITIGASSYLIKDNDLIYERLQKFFRYLEPKTVLPKERLKTPRRPKILLLGYEHVGRHILPTLKRMDMSYAIVDFDPQVADELARRGESVIYGDAADENFLAEIEADRARLIISTIPDVVVSLEILNFLRARGYRGTAIMAAQKISEAELCYEAGATYVIVPRILTGERLKQFLKNKKTTKTQWKKLAKEEQDFIKRAFERQ